jgi:hypothetical protein
MSESEVAPEESVEISDIDRLRGELEVLQEENERLRAEYARAKQSQYHRSAATLMAVGVLALFAGVVVTEAQTVLFALGGTGVFLGVLIYYLTPERFILASVSEAVYSSLAHNKIQVLSELGLSDERVYVPREQGESASGVRLFVPQRDTYAIPDDDALAQAFVATDDPRERGFAAQPTAVGLYTDFAETVSDGPSDTPAAMASELSDALIEQFELVDDAQAETTSDERVAVRVSGSAMGSINRFDHPVASLLGTGIALAADEPVTVDVATADDGSAVYIVTCSWGGEPETG